MQCLKTVIFATTLLLSVSLLASCSPAEPLGDHTPPNTTESSVVTTAPTTVDVQAGATPQASAELAQSGQTTTPSTSTTNSKPTTTINTEITPKTTRPATAEEVNLIRMRVESKYAVQLNDCDRQLQQALDDYEQQLRDIAKQYAINTAKLRERYANMGLLNSGAYQSALNGLDNKYIQDESAIRGQIQATQSLYDGLKNEIYWLIENEIAMEIEMLQQGTLS